MTNLEQEALTEVGNIILNAWLATRRHGGQWHRRVRPRIPRARRLSEIVAGTERDADTLLMLSIQFDLRELEINGRLLFLLEFAKLRSLINAIAGRLLGGAAGSA